MSLRTLIHKDISTGNYECIVCYDRVTSYTPIWSCATCYRVIDLKCAKEWAQRTANTDNGFKCPHCQIPQASNKLTYRCWCRKDVMYSKKKSNSKKSQHLEDAIPPHSCGQTCGAKRACPHPCPLTCHAGPHLDPSECMHMGPEIKCFCGRKKEKQLCSQSRYGGYSCGGKCRIKNKICGHSCSQVCHKTKSKRAQEPCGSCDHTVYVSCYCGRLKETTSPCSALKRDLRFKISSRSNKASLSCGKKCDAKLDCGHHSCELPCHDNQKEDLHVCPYRPYEGETCFCGKVPANRANCKDPKVVCGKICGKTMECGHQCREHCHEGGCPPCCEIVNDVSCRCHRSRLDALCGDTQYSQPLCDKKCRAPLSCGRHHCNEVCCEYNPKSMQAMALRKKTIFNKLNSLVNYGSNQSAGRPRRRRTRIEMSSSEETMNDSASPDDVEDMRMHLEHEAVEIQLTENAAGSTHRCSQLCSRLQSCRSHYCPSPCHTGPCPPCLSASFDEWECPCGRTRIMPPIRCGTVMPACSYRCHRPQSCGHDATHMCHTNDFECSPCSELVTKTCFCGKNELKTRCSNESVRCKQPCEQKLKCGHTCQKVCCPGGESCPPCSMKCGKRVNACNHAHETLCHFPDPCPTECQLTLYAQCPCGTLGSTYTCGEDLEIGCNETCVKESYSESLLMAFNEEGLWLSRLEQQIIAFVARNDKKTLWFQPMGSHHRRLVHLLLQQYGMSGESIDKGKMRSVCGHRTNETRICKFKLKDAPRIPPQVNISQPIETEIYRSSITGTAPEWDINFPADSDDAPVPFHSFNMLNLDNKDEDIKRKVATFKQPESDSNPEGEVDRLMRQMHNGNLPFSYLGDHNDDAVEQSSLQ